MLTSIEKQLVLIDSFIPPQGTSVNVGLRDLFVRRLQRTQTANVKCIVVYYSSFGESRRNEIRALALDLCNNLTNVLYVGCAYFTKVKPRICFGDTLLKSEIGGRMPRARKTGEGF